MRDLVRRGHSGEHLRVRRRCGRARSQVPLRRGRKDHRYPFLQGAGEHRHPHRHAVVVHGYPVGHRHLHRGEQYRLADTDVRHPREYRQEHHLYCLVPHRYRSVLHDGQPVRLGWGRQSSAACPCQRRGRVERRLHLWHARLPVAAVNHELLGRRGPVATTGRDTADDCQCKPGGGREQRPRHVIGEGDLQRARHAVEHRDETDRRSEQQPRRVDGDLRPAEQDGNARSDHHAGGRSRLHRLRVGGERPDRQYDGAGIVVLHNLGPVSVLDF